MIDLSSWPADRSEEERRMLAQALKNSETPQQAEQVMSAFLVIDIITDILMRPPVWREHWWQFWRMQQPGMLDG